eukprot:TRINITY_DN13470_c0_g2_i1.p1 TRINITY_DN13470_c0_g2~~TRINITY_DN13470_c0_g2_i1.p1  ORF type:complete len:132 (-),score=19.85 TRINITY_DN13470_c0_g2_i1:129-524(-)
MAAPVMNSNFQQVGQQFAQHYYQQFDSNRSQLGPLYGETSLMTWEGEQFMGAQNIVQKLGSLNFQTVQHQVEQADYQPIIGTQNVLVVISGKLIVDGGVATPMKFAQMFVLAPTPTGSFFVQNDMFRLNIG